MLGVDEIGKIRRAHLREFVRSRISRDLGVLRATVRKVLRSGATEFVCERRTPPRPKTGPWQSESKGILAENAVRPKRGRQSTSVRLECL